MINTNTKAPELSMKPLGQTNEEKIEALMRLGISRRRSLFIVTMRDQEVRGDTVNVSNGEYQKEKQSESGRNDVFMSTLEQYAGGELREVVANYEWCPVDSGGASYGVDVKIRVYKNSHGRFMAYPSHRVKTPRQATPYMSIYEQDSLDEALKDCIDGFKMFMGTAAETEWPENEYF